MVRYIDVDNKDEVVHTDNVTGKSGEKIAYTTETVLKSLIEKGTYYRKMVSLQMQLLIQMKLKFKNIQFY